jgi:hypothetical protein
MDFLRDLLIFLHLLGVAAIVGSALFVARGRVTPALLWGARLQLLVGLLLTGVDEAVDHPLDHTKIGVKLVVALAVVACAEIAGGAERRGRGSRPQLVLAAGLLALLNTAVAVFWH